jgi:hypothetical protein
MNRPANLLITEAYPGMACKGLRRSAGHCSTPALYVIHVGGIVYPVCGDHLWTFTRDVGPHDEMSGHTMNRYLVAVAVAVAMAVIAALWAIAGGVPAQADPTGDPGTVQTETPRPADLDRASTAMVSQIPGMHIIDPAITDSGGRKVCTYLDSHSREDTEAALLVDNPTFTPAEADAFVGDAEQVYCRAHIRQTIG